MDDKSEGNNSEKTTLGNDIEAGLVKLRKLLNRDSWEDE